MTTHHTLLSELDDTSWNTIVLEHPDGRRIGVGEHGDPEGSPVVLFPAAPGSRALDPDPTVTASAGVRLIVVDRAGYGVSAPHPGGTVPTWSMAAADVAFVIDQLGMADRGPVAVIGWSNGGLGALALAAEHPALVSSVTVIGTPAPHDEVPWIPDAFVEALSMLREQPEIAVDALAAELTELVDHPHLAVAGLAAGRCDDALLAEPTVASRLLRMVTTGFSNGAQGLANDIVATNIATNRPELGSITAPVRLVYGTDDGVINTAHGDYYRQRIINAELHQVDAGHLAIISRWRELLDRTHPV